MQNIFSDKSFCGSLRTMLLLLGLAFRHSGICSEVSFFFFGAGLLKCAKVNDYNLEIAEVTNVVTEAKENSFPTVTSVML